MAMTLITTNTSSNAASSSFTSSIDSTYKLYIFKFINIHNDVDGDNFAFNGSIDGGSNYNVTKTTTFFQAHHTEADATGLTYATNRDRAQSTDHQWLAEALGSGGDENLCGELFLFNPSNTTYVKHFYATIQNLNSGDGSYNSFVSGYFNTTSAINAMSFFSDGDSPAIDGTIKMYGVG